MSLRPIGRQGRGLLVSLLAAALLVGAGGCWPKAAETDSDFVLGDLVEPFEPPSLERLLEAAEWEEGPVIDSLELLTAHLEKHPPPAPDTEALRRRNDSEADNEFIRQVLGRRPTGDAEVNWDAEIIRHAAGDVKSTNPLLISSTTEFDVNGLTGFVLFGFDWEFNPFAAKDSVVRWQRSTNGMYDVVTLRDDLTWSDGEPITAHDVEFSYLVIMSDKVPVPAVRSGTDKLKYVKAYDDRTVVFFHKEPLATNVWNINFPIIPKHVYEKTIHRDPTLVDSDAHVQLEDRPVVGGAYVIKSRRRGDEIVLERREGYFMHHGEQVRARPYFKTIRFRFITDSTVALNTLKAGQIDEMILSPEQWVTQTSGVDFYQSNTKASDVEWVYFYFGWNQDPSRTPLFTDPRVRWAMTYAFDHEELLEKLRYGLDQPATGTFHYTSKWAPNPAPEPIRQDLVKAEQLLAEAGWVDIDGDGIRYKMIDGKRVPFRFTILSSNVPDRVKVCTLLKENLGRLGIECNVQPLEFAVLQQFTFEKKFDAFFGGWGTGTDPDTSENIWGTGEGRNYVGYSNPEVDRLFAEGRRELDPDKRVAIYQQIAQLLWDDQPYTWLYFRNAHYGFNKQLRGYYFSPRGPYNYGPGFSAIWKPAEQ